MFYYGAILNRRQHEWLQVVLAQHLARVNRPHSVFDHVALHCVDNPAGWPVSVDLQSAHRMVQRRPI